MPLHDIVQLLHEWKADDPVYQHSKNFQQSRSPLVLGEYCFRLTWKVYLTSVGIQEPVVQEKKFYTHTLAPEPVSQNPNADIYRLQQLLPDFDKEFLQKVDDVYGQFIEELNPGGFFD